MQKVMVCTTRSIHMKSPIEGWTNYNPEGVIEAVRKYPNKDVWRDIVESWRIDCSLGVVMPITPIHALAGGWKLLAPPIQDGDEFEWWFVQDDV